MAISALDQVSELMDSYAIVIFEALLPQAVIVFPARNLTAVYAGVYERGEGGDVVVIHASTPELLQHKVLQQLKLKSTLVDGTLRIERPRGHELIRELIDAFGGDIESVSFGKPTLEDVFVHLTGHKFDVSGDAAP